MSGLPEHNNIKTAGVLGALTGRLEPEKILLGLQIPNVPQASSEQPHSTSSIDRRPGDLARNPQVDGFQYSALEEGEIRLVSLTQCLCADRQRDGHLHIEIQHSFLDRCPKYTALSYAWGPPPDTKIIFINGSPRKIRTNLFTFLTQAAQEQKCRIRNVFDLETPTPSQPKPTDARDESANVTTSSSNNTEERDLDLIWIDALCINQNDLKEKASQVAKMRDIYSRSACILIWMGAAKDRSDEFFDALSSKGKKEPSSMPYNSRQFVRAASAFYMRDWWFRVWIIQEASTPHVPRIVRCGSRLAKFDTIQALLLTFESKFKHTSPLLATRYEPRAELRLQALIRLHNRRTFPSKFPDWQQNDILTILGFSRDFLATDARDKVYAIAPLFLEKLDDPKALALQPNYKISVHKLFHNVAIYLINKGLTHIMLLYCSNKHKLSHLSWVPDWSLPSTFGLFLNPAIESQVFQAWIKDGAVHGLSSDMEKLIVVGLLVDKVRSSFMIEPWAIALAEHFGMRSALLKHIANFFLPNRRDGEYTAGGLISEAAGRVLCADMYQDYDSGGLIRGKTYKIPVLEMFDFDDPEEPYNSNDVHHADHLGRPLFRSANGYLGICGTLPLPGDAIVLIIGMPVPMILRPKGEDWIIVGHCYVHGVMDGELSENAEPGSAKIFTLR
jgi:hypothetical protein